MYNVIAISILINESEMCAMIERYKKKLFAREMNALRMMRVSGLEQMTDIL